MTTTTKHPDFIKTISPKQAAWLKANAITCKPDSSYGFWFGRADHYIAPIAANDDAVLLLRQDHHEDSDGERLVAAYPRLRDALKALLEATG